MRQPRRRSIATPRASRAGWPPWSTSFDPDVIVLGGGLSQLAHLYVQLPALISPHIFADDTHVTIRPPRWGDASGARGAARLWD